MHALEEHFREYRSRLNSTMNGLRAAVNSMNVSINRLAVAHAKCGPEELKVIQELKRQGDDVAHRLLDPVFWENTPPPFQTTDN